ncbi:MAG TPA: VTT domain-containing protein [Solirubrobacter sp.]|jgi:membrane protein DedA with SNARE-associated domain|nr:VTT domain-containing protein [Solirubrobacter sp.]
MSDEAAALPRDATPLPWEGRPERADLILMGGIMFSGLYLLALMPLTPSLVYEHPVILELLKGSMTAMITMGAKARIGEASLLVAVLAAIPGLMWFDWLYWWAGKRWGKRAIDVFLGNHPKALQRTLQLEKLLERFGWLAVVIVYFQPLPNALVFAGAGLTGMRFRTFIVLDLISKLLWIAFCVGLGYALGQEAVDVAKAVSRYALFFTIALVVLIVARQWFKSRR